jgi:uncharacterized protein YecE (DUF72 family)
MLLQFPPWYNATFRPHLMRVLDRLPTGFSYAVELRDRSWFLGAGHAELVADLQAREISLAWSYLTYIDVPPDRTANWVYLRFIGDHTTIPAETHGEIRVDRSAETKRWADLIRESRAGKVWIFFNNHYAGFAPTFVNLLREFLGLPPLQWPDPPLPRPSTSGQRRLV